MLAALWAAWLFRPRSSWLLPPQRHRAVPWDGLQVFALALAVLFLCPWLTDGVLRGTPLLKLLYGDEFFRALENHEEYATARYLVWSAVLGFPLRLLAIVALVKLSGAYAFQIGLTPGRPVRNVLLGVISFCALTPLVRVVHLGVAWTWREYVTPPVPHALEKISQTQPHLVDWVLIFFSAVVTAAVIEELLFRGILQPWFASRPYGGDVAMIACLGMAAFMVAGPVYGKELSQDRAIAAAPLLFTLAMVPPYLLLRQVVRSPMLNGLFGASLLWAVAHSSFWPSPVSLFVFGLGLGLLYYRTQSVVPSMVAHALFNAVSFLELLAQAARHAKGH